MYCFAQLNLPKSAGGTAWYIPNGQAAPGSVNIWDGTTYHFSAGATHWIDQLTTQITPQAIASPDYQLRYTWYTITPERDTWIHLVKSKLVKTKTMTLQGDGKQVAFPTNNIVTPCPRFNNSTTWNPIYTTAAADAGVHYYYCAVELGARMSASSRPRRFLPHNLRTAQTVRPR